MADRKPTCGNCGWGKIIPENLKSRLCWGGPPTPVAFPVAGALQVRSMRPMVDAGEPGCGAHRFNAPISTLDNPVVLPATKVS